MNKIKYVLALTFLAFAAVNPHAFAQSQASSVKGETVGVPTQTNQVNLKEKGWVDSVSKYVGLTYFSFFNGPGLGEDFFASPNNLGNNSDKGWSMWTNLSVRLKLFENLAIDYQFRLEQILSNDLEWRDQGGRLGISGKLLSGEDWALTGALNTDIPGVGQVPKARTLVLNPGLFANFSYKPKASNWSVFALVAPRFFIYRDALALEAQSLQGGSRPGDKPEISIQLQPSINYAFNDRHGARLGVLLDVRKNANMDSMRRWFWPVDMGYTYSLSKSFNLYPHVRFSGPWDNGLRDEIAGSRGRRAQPWVHTASVGLWINGTIL
jgi:hypothetical protein